MYQDIKTKREKAKQEHIKQETEKAKQQLAKEEKAKQDELKRNSERIKQEQSSRALRESREREREERASQSSATVQSASNSGTVRETTQTTTSNTGAASGADWSQVSPQQASQYMQAKTGISASTWEGVILRESSNNPTVTNSIGCFGYLQLHPVHGNVSTMSPQQYLDTAVQVYQSQGASAWEAW